MSAKYRGEVMWKEIILAWALTCSGNAYFSQEQILDQRLEEVTAVPSNLLKPIYR